MNKRLGIIQSRGLGDLYISLPIAGYYRDQGYTIHWPIAEQFLSTMQNSAPWVHWHSLKVDNNLYFYDTPLKILEEQDCEDIICLYQALSSKPELTERAEFQITKFDQIKYSEAQVPFTMKWRLNNYITRNTASELELVNKLNLDGRPLALVHLQGSDHTAHFDFTAIPNEYQVITVREGLTDNFTDWLAIVERSDIVVCVDSALSNLIDQVQLTENRDCYFIPRSHIQLTPVMGGLWHYIDPDDGTRARIRIFR